MATIDEEESPVFTPSFAFSENCFRNLPEKTTKNILVFRIFLLCIEVRISMYNFDTIE